LREDSKLDNKNDFVFGERDAIKKETCRMKGIVPIRGGGAGQTPIEKIFAIGTQNLWKGRVQLEFPMFNLKKI